MTWGIAISVDWGNSGLRIYIALGSWNSDRTEFCLFEGTHPVLVSRWAGCSPGSTSTPSALASKEHEPKAWGKPALQYIYDAAYHVERYPKKKFAELAGEKANKDLRYIMTGMKYVWGRVLEHVLGYAENYYGLDKRPAILQVCIGVPSGWDASLVQRFLETSPDFGCHIIVRTETSAILQSYLHETEPKVGQVYIIADYGSSTQNFGLLEVERVDPLVSRELASGGSSIGTSTMEDVFRKKAYAHLASIGARASVFKKENDQIIDEFMANEFEDLKLLVDGDSWITRPVRLKPEPFMVEKGIMDSIREEMFTLMDQPMSKFLSQCEGIVAEMGKEIELVVVSGGISGSDGFQSFIRKAYPDGRLAFPNKVQTEDVARGLMYLAIRPLSCSRDTVGRHYGIGSDDDYDPDFHNEDDKLKKNGDPELSDKLSDDEETYNLPEDGLDHAKTVRWIIFPDSKTTETFNLRMKQDFDMNNDTIWVDVFTLDLTRFSGDIHALKQPRNKAVKVNTYAVKFRTEFQAMAKRRKEQGKPCDTLPYYVLFQPEGEDLKVSVVWDLNGTDMKLHKLLSSDSKCEKSFNVHRAIGADEASKRKCGPEHKETNKRLKISSEAVNNDVTGDPGSGDFSATASTCNSSELSSPGQTPLLSPTRPLASTSEPTITPLPGPSPPVSPAVGRIMKSSISEPPGIATERTSLPSSRKKQNSTANSPGSTSILLKSNANKSTPAFKTDDRKGSRTSARKLLPRNAAQPPPHPKAIPRNDSEFEGLYSWTSRTPITLKFSKYLLKAIHSKKQHIYKEIRWSEIESIWRLPSESNPDWHVYFLFSSTDNRKSFVITNPLTGTKPREILDANDTDRRTELDRMFDKHLIYRNKNVLMPRKDPLYIKAYNGPIKGVLIFLYHPGIHNDTLERNVMIWGLQSPLYLPVVTLDYNIGLEPKPDRSIDLHISVEDEDHRFTDLQCDKDQLKTLRSHLCIKRTFNVSGGQSIYFAEATGKAKTIEQEADKAREKAKMLKKKKKRKSISKCGRPQDDEPVMMEKIKRGAVITSDNEGFDDESANVGLSRQEFVGWSGEMLAGDLDSEDDSDDDDFDPADHRADCDDD